MKGMWLGVDLGNARVGLALSDPERTLATPAGNIHVAGDYFQALDEVIGVIEDEEVTRVIVGLPLLMDGTDGPSAKKARRWVQQLTMRMARYGMDSVPVELHDERLTTVSAHRMLFEAGVGSRSHRPRVDQQSAVVLLQAALDDAARREQAAKPVPKPSQLRPHAASPAAMAHPIPRSDS